MTQSIEALSQDYRDALDIQQQVIDRVRARLNKAYAAVDCATIERLNRSLRILYDEKYELQERHRALQSYLKQTAAATGQTAQQTPTLTQQNL